MPERTINLRRIMYIGFFLRVILTTWKCFVNPNIFAEPDALGFHQHAVFIAQNGVFEHFQIGPQVFMNFLGGIYYLTTASLFLGTLLSCVVWLVSARLLLNSMRLLSFDESHQYKAMRIYAFLPASVFLTSVTLREPYQLLFVNLALYSALKIYLSKSTKHWLVLICAVTGMGVLHGSLFASGLFMLIATLVLLAFRGRKALSLQKLVFILPIVAVITYYGIGLFMSAGAYNIEGGLESAITAQQLGSLGYDARTNYKTSVDVSGVGLLFFIPVSLFQYLFEPMPWRVSAVSDIVSLFENTLRAWLIWKACVSFKNIPMQERRPVMFAFVSYLIIETIWSLGVINWGTALRHHIPATGLLLVSAYAYSGKPGKRRMMGT